MASTKEIKRRIKSVNNIKKITKAMEMVSAAKMRKAIEAVLKTRPYSDLCWHTLLNLSEAIHQKEGALHPLLEKKDDVKKVGIVLITSNRGLCGGFNTALINKVINSIKKYHHIDGNAKINTEFILTGKKGSVVGRQGHNIVADFPKQDLVNEIKEIIPIVKMAIDGYLNGKYDKVMLAYTDFVNPMKQVPRVKQILPVDITKEDEALGVAAPGLNDDHDDEIKKHESLAGNEYVFEPTPEKVLNDMIPRIIEVQLFQAMLESNASEHSARMAAMKQATDSAEELVDELNLTYNKARQASITNEIAEISAGANALSE